MGLATSPFFRFRVLLVNKLRIEKTKTGKAWQQGYSSEVKVLAVCVKPGALGSTPLSISFISFSKMTEPKHLTVCSHKTDVSLIPRIVVDWE